MLFVATKAPYPPVGGGNAALHRLVTSLQDAGAGVRVVALGPAQAADGCPYRLLTTRRGRRSLWGTAAGLLGGAPAALARYRVPALAGLVEEALRELRPHVVQLEQLHVAWLLPSLLGRVPVVLRAQNVESRLVARMAALSSPPLRVLLEVEARRMARVEAWACTAADLVAAISEPDAGAFRSLAPGARVTVLPIPWSAEAEPAARLDGDPPLVALGSFDWRPNRDGVLWMLAEVWPRVRDALPGAVLHLAGPGSETLPAPAGVVRHGRVPSTAALHDPRGVALVPVRAGSGVRVRLLEAWAAGMPCVTTSVGCEGLLTAADDGALVADEAAEFAAAVIRAAVEPGLRRRLTEAGRHRLEAHRGERIARQALDLYTALAAGAAADGAERRQGRPGGGADEARAPSAGGGA